MRARNTLGVRTGLAAIAVGLIGAGCFTAPPPPPGPAHLTVSPSQLSFTAVHAGPMPTATITVTNTGGRSARSVGASPVGVYSLPQPPAPNPCQGSGAAAALGPGQSCVIDVQYCPAVVGTDNNTLVVTGVDTASGAGLLAGVNLFGTAT
jgi:hypothetical protein